MHKRVCLILLGLIITGCTSTVDRANELNARVLRLNQSMTSRDADYTFNVENFHDSEKYKLLSWANNPSKKDTYIKIVNHDEVLVLSYVEGHYSLSNAKRLGQDYNDFVYDVLVFDDRSQEFVLFSSQLNAPAIDLISMNE